METLEQHNREKATRLKERRIELNTELLDVESYLADLEMPGGDATLYIGCHTGERHEDGSPRHKAESVFQTSLTYARAVKLLRGLNDIVKKLLAFSCDDTKESWSWKDLFRN